MSMTSVHVYMPAMKLYRLCCICQVYIYIFRVFTCLRSVRRCVCYACKYLQDVNVYIVRICVYAKCLYVYIPACSCINWVTSASYVCLYARHIVICADVYMQGVWIYKSIM